jgi:hypothetical protein
VPRKLKKANYPFPLINAKCSWCIDVWKKRIMLSFCFEDQKYLRGCGAVVSKLLSAQTPMDFGVK